ncbi:MAG: TonB-dependent receptor [Lewinellaceae bacterium]|nr:TonB-dependent receptor [Lewinellaceae bacterium]
MLMFGFLATVTGQEKFNVSGYVRDLGSGESLPGANIYVKGNPQQGTQSNAYGFFSLRLEAGSYTLVFSYLGYTDMEVPLELVEDSRLSIDLEEGVALGEVVVTATDADNNVSGTEMGQVMLPIERIKKIPALMGEVDILKTLQLLPGVLSAGEGNAGFYVRGGGPDQNLVLLDEAVVYNSGHLLGFFSVFNSDAIKTTNLIKGGMPAQYGGRLSSVVDVQMKDGNAKHLEIDGGIGLIASRLTVQGPITKERSSFLVSARRTYALDLAQPAIKQTDFAGTNYYFYDLNAKVNHRFSDKDRVYLSAYFGRDVLKFRSPARDFFFNLPYGNATATLRWNHLFNDRLFVNVSAIYNDYDFEFEGGQDDFSIDVFSGVRDWNGKIDFDYFPSNRHAIKFGVQGIYHRLTPNVANARSGEETFSNNFEPKFAYESGLYFSDDFKVSDRLRVQAGLRFSLFTQLGPYTSPESGRQFARGEAVVTYPGWEPRLNVRYAFSTNSSLKASLTWSNQYLHLVSNSSSTLPADVWVPSSERVKPQQGVQYALGYFKNLSRNRYETSLEVYYRDLRNQIDYRESYVNNAATDLEDEFVFGKGRAYGAELLLRKNEGKLTGWIGYTLSRTERIFPDINEGNSFPAVYDRRHDLAVVATYEINDRWDVSGVFVFGTGNAFTPIQSLFLIGQQIVPNYGPRNSARIVDYHRMDLSANYRPRRKEGKDFYSFWTFSVYNLYSRKNPFFTYYDFTTDPAKGTAKASGYQVSLFPIIPAVTWNFRWSQDPNE